MIKRSAESYLEKLAGYYPVITVVGPRQSGKTTLVKSVFKDAAYVNLEVSSARNLAQSDPEGFLRKYPAPLIIDEVQRVPELLSNIQAIVDENPKKASYILTGSHQPLLRQGVSQSLAGRTGILHLLPLSIAELVGAGRDFERDEYILNGFMPRIYNEEIPPEILYRDYFQTYVERDVNQMLRIVDRSKFELFVRLLAGRVGQLLNLQSMAGEIGVTSTTLASWLSVLEASYLVFRLPCYYKNYGKRLLKTPKIYFTDVGLAASLLNIHTAEQVGRDPLAGGLFENLVVIEALKAQMNAGETPELYYWRDKHGLEVDLLIPRGRKLQPVEIKSSYTFHPGLAQGLEKFCSIGTELVSPTVVYSGSSIPSAKGVSFCNFKESWCSGHWEVVES